MKQPETNEADVGETQGETASEQKLRAVRVTHSFKLPPEQVFDAWLKPELAAKWLFATDTGQIVNVEIEPRVRGVFRIVDRREDGDVEHIGEYITVERPHRLVFEFAVPQYSPLKTRVAVEIEMQWAGCVLGLTHDGVPAEYAERTHAGWAKLLDRLDACLMPAH